MPELPEVETVRRVLAKKLVGKTFSGATVFWPKSIATGAVAFSKEIGERTIEEVKRRGKFLLIGFDDHSHLVCHLRMEGKLFLFGKGETDFGKFARVILHLADGEELVFDDIRKFGRFWFYPPKQPITCIENLGPEANDLSPQYVLSILKATSRPIKEVLLDQTKFAGIGNIYADEIFFAAKINPFQKATKIATAHNAALIASEAKRILDSAIECHGSTVRTYRASNKVLGQYQSHLFVYSRSGKKCLVCGTKIMKRELNGRGTSFCPHCQKVPKVIGITGGIASGKTTIRKILEEMGFKGIDTDSLAKEMYGEARVRDKLEKSFPDLFDKSGNLDKGRLYRLLLDDKAGRRKWLGILYPLLKERIVRMLDDEPDTPFAIEAPLLFQAHLGTLCSLVILALTKDPLAKLKERGDPHPQLSFALGQTNTDWIKHRKDCDRTIETDSPLASLPAKVREALE